MDGYASFREMDEELGVFTTHLRMAYTPQTVLGELRTAELFVVSCLRLWAHTYYGCKCGYPNWRKGLEHAGISAAGAEGFDTLWRIVATTALQGLDVRHIRCAHLGEDEGRFLYLLSLLQNGRALEAEVVLSGWCPPTAVRLALTPAVAFATALSARGLQLPDDLPGQAESASRLFAVPTLDASRVH